jgi:glycosyltransferase involved in cell wall biosynthesis
MYLQLLESAHKFDIVHIHTNVPLSELVISKKISIPCVFTIHSISRLPDIEGRIMKNFSSINNYFISISNKQRTTFSSLNFTKTIYHGVDTHKFSFDLEGGLNMLFTGRLRNNKGVKEAIETAVISKHKILVAGALSSTDHDYFDHEIKPRSQKYKELLDVDIEPNRELINLKYQKAKLTLLPIKWEEPFGLVMIESMACGTPVVAFARGSVPEIIKDGETGFIVNSSPEDIRGDWIVKKTGIEGLCEAVEKIYAMPEEKYRAMRHACRAHVEDNFNIEKMIENYEQLYYEILKKQVNKLNYG